MQAFVIDAFAFSRLEEQRSGSILVADLPRLSEESANTTGELSWSLQGGKDKLGHAQLELSVSGSVQLMCQRCLTPFAFDIDSESILILAKNEENADEIEALLEDDEIDVVVGSKAFNIMDLIEDEALLAIPQSPKHAVCPDLPLASADTTAAIEAEVGKKESPFAVLKKINGRT
ncbi:YceD family protein [Undibacterium sp. TS12]|uniref:YceD family protein n=1 Tax=Undibacterium sp. TS12 TaxID=2908202 RepID=UPI001F4D0644|nr:YceD family protein [Undibacterium sp. TS12]MCH8618464.1 YceD family protein [Undibacterium sp. TS12]